jgi:hypothetical protein
LKTSNEINKFSIDEQLGELNRQDLHKQVQAIIATTHHLISLNISLAES